VADFTDLQSYVALPRLAGLALSSDGTRLVTTAAALDRDRTAWRPALWEIDPAGQAPAHRLTFGEKGESQPRFTPQGDLLFVTGRQDPATKDAPETASVWRLPVRGEARSVATRAGGVAAVEVARDAGTVLVTSPTLPGSGDDESDTARRRARKDGKVSAILHAGYPVRNWDNDVGPDEPRLLVHTADGWRDLTPTPRRGKREAKSHMRPCHIA